MVKQFKAFNSDEKMQNASKARGNLRNKKRSKSSSNNRMSQDPKDMSNRASMSEIVHAEVFGETLQRITTSTDCKDLSAYVETLGADLAQGATLTTATIINLHAMCMQQLTQGEHFLQTKLPFASAKKTVTIPICERGCLSPLRKKEHSSEDIDSEDSDECCDEHLPRVKLYSTDNQELFDSENNMPTMPDKFSSKHHKAALGISKKSLRFFQIKTSLFKLPKAIFPTQKLSAKKTADDMSDILERIASLQGAEKEEFDDSYSTMIYFLRETLEYQFDHLIKEVKKCFFFKKDLRRLEVYDTNHQHLIIGKVCFTPGITHGLLKAKSCLFTTKFGNLLFSKQHMSSFKVYNDLMANSKVKELTNY